MTEAEAAALVRGLYEGKLLVHGEVFNLGPFPGPVPLPGRASPVNATILCADGGHATFEGVATAEIHAGQVTVEASGSLAARKLRRSTVTRTGEQGDEPYFAGRRVGWRCSRGTGFGNGVRAQDQP